MTRLGLIGIFILCVSCRTRETKETENISNKEKEILFTVTDLINSGYQYETPLTNSEKFEKLIFDGGYQLDYKYQTPDSSGVKFILINTSLMIYDDDGEAQQTYYGILSGSSFKSFFSDKVEQTEKKGILSFGDNSKVLEFRGNESQIVVGYVFISQFDNKVYLTYFMTPFIEKMDVWSSILPDKLRKAKNFGTGSRREI